MNLPDDYATLAGCPDANLRQATGADWPTWLARIDAWGGADQTHAQIATWVAEQVITEGGKEFWWAQAVTVGYERLRRRRAIGQTCDGTWAASKSATVAGDLTQVRALLLDAARFTRWAPPGLQVRPTSSPSSVRYTDIDGHTVSIWLTQKPGPRCTVAVQVEGLPSEEARGAAKTAWGEHLRHLKALADGD